MDISPDLETHFQIFLLVLYVIIPMTLLLLKCFLLKNVPLKDIFYLVTAFSSFSLLVWIIILLGTNLYCTTPDGCGYVPYGGLENTYLNIVSIVLLPIF